MKEPVLRIVVFVLLLAVFCIVALTASWTDKGADDQVAYPSSGINESGADSTSTQSPINHFSENGKEPGPNATYSGRTANDADVLELATASTHYRVNYHRKDPNDLKYPDVHKDSDARMDSDASKNDREDAADIVE